MKLIDKDVLVAEIDRRMSVFNEEKVKKEATQIDRLSRISLGARIAMLEELKAFINTLEVKEVDLERELETLDSILYDLDGVAVKGTTSYLTVENVKDIAKHFFELGKANQENNVIGILERVVKIDAGGYPCIDCYIEFYDYDKDIPLAKEGDKVKVVIIKGE